MVEWHERVGLLIEPQAHSRVPLPHASRGPPPPLGEDLGARAWDAARGLIGTPFRLHGRDPASGLDCVGLVAAAYRGAGLCVSGVPDRYRLSGPEPEVAAAWLAACGAVLVTDAVRAGDVLLADLGTGGRRQLHLLLLGLEGAIHAHAGLRRVVCSPEVPGVPVGRWRVEPLQSSPLGGGAECSEAEGG